MIISDRLSRACSASEMSALGAFLPTVDVLGDDARKQKNNRTEPVINSV